MTGPKSFATPSQIGYAWRKVRERFKVSIAVFAVARVNGKVLMILRSRTGMMDGYWSLPAGGVDGGELAPVAAVRELEEETTVVVDAVDAKLVHTQHNFTHGEEWIGLYFETTPVRGEARVAEPHKHGGVAWFFEDDLPVTTVPYVRQALARAADGATFSSYDDRASPWPGAASLHPSSDDSNGEGCESISRLRKGLVGSRWLLKTSASRLNLQSPR